MMRSIHNTKLSFMPVFHFEPSVSPYYVTVTEARVTVGKCVKETENVIH